jgi:glycine/D-amino acid oxidase-like deaminating enzyme/nitrite reductase/ring-hydroxylating ferredoxin subunit
MKRDGATKSIWQNLPEYTAKNVQSEQKNYDVIIVGGGITGITTALLLQNSGKKCLIAESKNIGFGTTSGTTAHLNTILDLTYAEIEKNFGEENTKIVLSAVLQAINIAESNVIKHNIDCDFSEHNGYLFSTDEQQTKKLDEAFEASQRAGCDVEYSDTIPVPVDFKKALVFKRQAQIHPTKYLYGLAKAFENAGGRILQQCRVTEVKENDEKILEVETSFGKMKAANLIYATHIPPGVNLLHFRCAPYRSYAMALTLKDQNYPVDLAYDLYDPYHYYRSQEIDGKTYLIAGGEDHRTAEKKDTQQCFVYLENYLRKHFEVDEEVYKWSSQYFEPADGLPYIGHLPGNPKNVFVATGYGGNGVTYSQIASQILCDLIVKGKSEYENIFNPLRIKPVAGFENFIENAADVTINFIEKLFPAKKIDDLNSLQNGEAKLIKYKNQSIAIYKDENGKIHSVDPACTHINCTVAWNTSEKIWECPCHGSRFNEDGEMFTAPARKNLQKINFED